MLLRSRAQHRCEALLLPAEGQGDGEGGKLADNTLADFCCGRGLRLVFSAVGLGSESCIAGGGGGVLAFGIEHWCWCVGVSLICEL